MQFHTKANRVGRRIEPCKDPVALDADEMTLVFDARRLELFEKRAQGLVSIDLIIAHEAGIPDHICKQDGPELLFERGFVSGHVLGSLSVTPGIILRWP